LAVAAGGCKPAAAIRPGDIRTYTIPKDAEPVGVAEAGSLPAAPPDAVAGGGLQPPPGGPAGRAGPLRYEVPTGWSDGGPSGMRLATLFIGDAPEKREVTVIPASGSLVGNVERWQGQLDPAADAADVTVRAAAAIAAAESIDVGGTTATMVLLRDATAASDATQGQAILGAMIPVDGDRAVFVKFKGDSAVADRERERFAAFVSSIRWKE